MPVMAHDDSTFWVASLQVYKDGRLVDTVHLQGQPDCRSPRWIAGRHADCNVWLGHASISRRHLQIQVLHATQELLLVDLHSVHGTRVNGDALTPGSPYLVKQGDTVQMGASTRSYKVDWVLSMGMDQQASEAAASVLERSSPNGSETSFRYKLGNVQGAKKKPAKVGFSKGMTKSVSSPTRGKGQRGRRPELPPRTPIRRVPFANVQASALNKRSSQGLPLKKAATLPEKLTPSEVFPGLEDRRIRSTAREVQEDGLDRPASPNFWLWRCSSAPVPTLLTAVGDSCAHHENEAEILPVFSRECSGEDSRSDIPVKSSSVHDEYPSDKENWEPGNMRRTSASWDGRQSFRSPSKEEDGQPFAGLEADSKWLKPLFSSPLASSPDSHIGPRSKTSILRPPRQLSSSALVNNLDSLLGKLKLGGELLCQWHVVVDTNCLLDTDALKSLKHLEGIRETRIIVPQIVLRELDGLKRRHDVGHSARMALKWIEDCMERIPFWMHVQTSTETPPLRRTPPSSPSRIRSIPIHSNLRLMSLTNDDHILDCALLFVSIVTDGRVVLLTRDTALKIKAKAEGLTVEDATSFSESLLSPYSERFLWLGSTAYLPSVKALSSLQFTAYDESYAAALYNSPFSASHSELRSKKKLSPEAKGHGKHGVAEFRCHYSERPQGLQVVLT